MNRWRNPNLAVTLVALCFWSLGMVDIAVADLVGPHGVSGTLTTAERLQARAQWERQLVAQWLRDYGYAEDQVITWMSQLTDEDVHELILQAENLGLPYGSGALETIVLILIIILLIIIILELTGKEIIIR